MRKITRFVSVPKSLHTYRIRNASVYQGTQGELSPNRVREGEQLFLAACQTARTYACLDWETMHFLYDVYYYHIHDLLASLLDNPSMSPESKVSYFRTVLDAPLFAQIGETSNRMVWLVDQMFLRLLTPAPPLPLETMCKISSVFPCSTGRIPPSRISVKGSFWSFWTGMRGNRPAESRPRWWYSAHWMRSCFICACAEWQAAAKIGKMPAMPHRLPGCFILRIRQSESWPKVWRADNEEGEV